MKSLYCCAAVAIVSTSLAAQTTGRIVVKVTDSSGKPIPNASLVMKRFDVSFTREGKTDKSGNYIQVGLYPTDYEMIVSAPGYVDVKSIVKVPLNDVINKNIIMKTVDESLAEAGQQAAPETLTASQGDQAYTEAVQFYNDKKYVEAMPKFELAIDYYNQSLAEVKDESSIADIKKYLTIARDSLAISQYQVGKDDVAQRQELWQKAEPVLTNDFNNTPNDKPQDRARLASFLAEIARARGDVAATKKYEGVIEEVEGPKAENSYNTAVDLFNAGNLSEAKPHLIRALEINPNFAETYYLLAICEYADSDLKAAKTNLQKYIELEPKGKYAAEVREMLDDPSIKNLK